MNSRRLRVSTAIAALLLFSICGFAQEKPWKAASFDGTTGLFKVWDAETLRQGEINFSVGWDQFHRDPGQLEIGRLPVGAAVGILDRFEFFASMDVQRRIEADNILFYRQNVPGLLPSPARTPLNVQYFSQVA